MLRVIEDEHKLSSRSAQSLQFTIHFVGFAGFIVEYALGTQPTEGLGAFS
jgi:hypothetical protein